MKKILLYLFILHGLTACGNAPSNNPNAKMAPVVFEDDISYNPLKEQQFDFYFNPQEDKTQRFRIGLTYWIPSDDDKATDYFNELNAEWQRGNKQSSPYFDVTLEHHLENGQIRLLPLTGIIRSTFDRTEVQTFTIPPAQLTVLCQDSQIIKDNSGNKYLSENCSMFGLQLDDIPDYRDGFFRLKIKTINSSALEHNITTKMMVLHDIEYK